MQWEWREAVRDPDNARFGLAHQQGGQAGRSERVQSRPGGAVVPHRQPRPERRAQSTIVTGPDTRVARRSAKS